MNIVIDPTTFNENNIFFLDKKKNNIIDGYFSKIIYSSEVFIMNGVFLLLPLVIKTSPDNGTIIERRTNACISEPSTLSHEHRYSIYFYTHHLVNLQYITILSEMENAIINMYKEINCVKKNNNLGLSNQLHKGCFKIYKERKNGVASQKKYMLKISGVWENAIEVGITYKFLEIV